MKTIENSKVDGKTDYLIFPEDKYSSCQQTRKPSSTKSDDSDQYDTDLTEDVEKLSGSPQVYNELISYKEYKEELFRITDKTIELEAKNLLSDSGCFLPDSEEDETSVDSGNGTRSEETTDRDSEEQDDGDSNDADSDDVGARLSMVPIDDDDDLLASQDTDNDAEDSCEMTYIELDLSSQSYDDVSDVSDIMELMMENLNIGPSQFSFDSNSYAHHSNNVPSVKIREIVEVDEEKDPDAKTDDIPEKLASNLRNLERNDNLPYIENREHENTSSNLELETKTEYFESFLPIPASSLYSLSEKAYIQIAEHLLDERTELKLNVEENFSNTDSCGTTLIIRDNITEMESSSQDLKSTFAHNDNDPPDETYPMTYVDLDINEPCSEDMTLKMFENLNIEDDKSPLCRGNPSDQNTIQAHPLCSEIDMSDYEIPALDLINDPPFLIDTSDSTMDFSSSLTSGLDVSSIPDFYTSQRLGFSSEFNFHPADCLLSFSKDSTTNTSRTSPDVSVVRERLPSGKIAPICSILPPGASSTPYIDNSYDVSFFDDCFENIDAQYENEFVTENLHILNEIDEFLGLSNPEIPNTGLLPPPPSLHPPPLPQTPCPSLPPPHPSFPPPPRPSNNILRLPFPRPCITNMTPMETPYPVTCQSSSSNVITRVTTQTPSTQSDAIPAFPDILVVLSPSIHGLKRPTCIEMSEPAKKPFRYDNCNNYGLSEVDSRKKAKQEVANLSNEQLLEFTNNESRLHEAVRSTNSEYVLALLERLKKCDSQDQVIINSKNDKLQTPLHLAVQANIPAIVHLLIKHGAEVNHLAMTPSKKLETPLHYVASQGIQFRTVFNCLWKATDLDIDIKNSEGQTALLCATVAHRTTSSNCANSIGSEYIIKKLLTRGADPLIQDKNGKNILMYAIETKDLNLVSLIMKIVTKDQNEELLATTSSNGLSCLSLAHSLKEQFTQFEWDKLGHILTRHTSGN